MIAVISDLETENTEPHEEVEQLRTIILSSRETNARVSRTVLTDTAADIPRKLKMTNFEVRIESWEKDIFRAHVLVTTRKRSVSS